MGCELGFGGYTGFARIGKSQDANQGRLRLPCQYIPVSIRGQYIPVSIRSVPLGVTQVLARWTVARLWGAVWQIKYLRFYLMALAVGLMAVLEAMVYHQ